MPDELLQAIQTGNLDRLAALLASGADPNTIVTSYYYTMEQRYPVLFFALRDLQSSTSKEPGQPIEAVVLLLRYGADVNRWDDRHRYTPILAAAQNDHIDAARILLAHGADPNVMDDQGYTPLRYCAQEGYLEMARLLLLCGATKTIDGWGGCAMTALGHAASKLNVEMVKLLLAHGADPQGRNIDEMTALDCMEYIASPKDPAAHERFREIRQLLGEPREET